MLRVACHVVLHGACRASVLHVVLPRVGDSVSAHQGAILEPLRCDLHENAAEPGDVSPLVTLQVRSGRSKVRYCRVLRYCALYCT